MERGDFNPPTKAKITQSWSTGPIKAKGLSSPTQILQEPRAEQAMPIKAIITQIAGQRERIMIPGSGLDVDDHLSKPGDFHEKAYEENQKYKEGKFILEKARLHKEGSR
ncbi:hypothetical protein Taro_028815 [Colocasia esculenta]|uniref:Uncharacterized protein n=1 Tax=Colocasia esculenta TaxID=4460 RepID=A0A843VC95_COLES|nr:hypothetical protein [Colocasia esculenta]